MSRRGPRFELVVTGPVQPAVDDLEAIGARARNAKPLMAKILQRLTEIEREQFATDGARSGQPWPAKKPETIERQARAGYTNTRPQRFTGKLEQSLTSQTGLSDAIRRPAKQSATFGSRLFYGAFQDAQLIGVVQRDRDWIADAISNWLLDGAT